MTLEELQAAVAELAAKQAAPVAPASAPATPPPAPAIDYDKMGAALAAALKAQQPAPAAPVEAPRPAPAMAPSAPSGHGLPTQNGIVDLFSLTESQRKELGPQGVRKVLEQLVQIGNDQAGVPRRPKPPGGK